MQFNSIYELEQKVRHCPDFIDFTKSNFSDLLTSFPSDILIQESSKYFASRNYQPDSKGLLVARQAIADEYNSSPKNIIITSSTSESYNLLFSVITNPGDEILLPSPTYPLFGHIAELNKIKTKFYKLDRKNNWQIDMEDLRRNITSKTKFVVLISPNNPTGQIISHSQFMQICSIAEEKGIAIILDEVFADLIYAKADKLIAPPNLTIPIYRLNGISKLFALPDLKLSWIMVEGNTSNIERLEIANDMFLNTNYLSQSLLPALFEQGNNFRHELRQELKIRAQQTNEAFKQANFIEFTAVRGGIHLMFSIKKNTKWQDEESLVLQLLEKYHMLIHPGYFYDYEEQDYMNFVVTVFNSEKLSALTQALKSLHRSPSELLK